MCTVVIRRKPGQPPHVLALRDELVGRAFDDPGRWWPDHPDCVGGRDQQAGGTWCVTDVAAGVTGLVLNRPPRRTAAAGAPSRGVLPLLAVRDGESWSDHLDLEGMASFRVVLVEGERTLLWDFDGRHLTRRALDGVTEMVTSGGAEDGKAARYLPLFEGTPDEDWQRVVGQAAPQDDARALVVRHPATLPDGSDGVFATVAAQHLVAVPGRLELAWTRTPSLVPWTPLTFASPCP